MQFSLVHGLGPGSGAGFGGGLDVAVSSMIAALAKTSFFANFALITRLPHQLNGMAIGGSLGL
jgi:hypothetical protein